MRSMNRSRAWSMVGGFLAVVPLLACAVPAYADDGDDDDAPMQSDATNVTVTDGYADTDPSAPTAFQSDLSPYGTWVIDGTYGTVWVPNGTVVGADFAPYQSSGHWAMTDDGEWLWVSDYSWGYIPFHYGRWLWIDGRGWSWIPGRAYAPSWVVWRVGGDGYIGWAPMPPTYYWSDGVYVSIDTPLPAPYSFCETGYVFDDNVQSHVVRTRADVQKAAGSTHPFVNGHHYLPASPSIKDAHLSVSNPPRHGVPDNKAIAISTHPQQPVPKSGSTGGGSTTQRAAGRGSAETSRNIKPINVEHPASGATRNETVVAPSAARPSARPSAPTVAHPASSGRTSPAPAHVSRPAQTTPAFHPSHGSAPQTAARPAAHPAAPTVTPVSSHRSAAPIRSAGAVHHR